MARFSSWRRSRLVHNSTVHDNGGLKRTLQVSLTDSSQPAPSAPESIEIVFRSAAAVARLTEQSIRHRAPAPGIPNEETTKCTHVDFHSPDLPWRYTPETATNDQLRPWMALIIGTPDEVKISGATVTMTQSVLTEYNLTTSYRWAHVQTPDTEMPADLGRAAPDRFSRLLSLRPLRALTTYVAVIVPTFNASGGDLWVEGVLHNDGRPIPALSWWTFSTGEGGDFNTLAAQLRIPPAGDLGKAHLTFRAAEVPIGPLEVRGALQSLQGVQQDVPGEAQLARDVATAVLASSGAPDQLGPPTYGRPWVHDPLTATGWVEQLRQDARMRIHAGTGQWTGVEAQDELMEAAITQAGSLSDAAGLIAHTATGLAISGSLWERSLPADSERRLRVIAPMTTRLPTDDTVQMVADAVTTLERNLDRSLLTGAGQRLLTRSARLERTPIASAVDLLQATNTRPESEPDPRAVELWASLLPPNGQDLYLQLWRALAELRTGALTAHGQYLRQVASLTGLVDPEHLAEREREFLHAELPRLQGRSEPLRELAIRCEEWVWSSAAQAAGLGTWEELLCQMMTTGYATDLIYGPVQTTVLQCLIPQCDWNGRPVHPESPCSRLVALLQIPAPWDKVPLPLPALGDAVCAAIDPTSDNPPAQRSLDQQLPPVLRGRLAPPRYPLGLDFPTWTLLRRYQPDWLLPEATTVPKHTIVALRTNPAFIDAFLIGLNSQFLSEVRWRGLQVDRWGTPLRMFFAPTDERTSTRKPDILPIENWPAGSQLGADSHQTPTDAAPGSSERLIVLFTTPLFRRYPRTLVYLQKRLDDDELNELTLQEPPQLTAPSGMSFEQWKSTRHHIPPLFTGTISPDQVFFLFDIPPDTLDRYFLVLDEPPSEQRFRNDLPCNQFSSAAVAEAILDPRTRVALDGQALEAMGLDPQ